MREGSPNPGSTSDLLNGPQPAAKSLLWNILQVSPCGSRFCGDAHPIPTPQVIQNQNLRKKNEKMESDQVRAKSLFQNILPVSSCSSIFCADSTLSPPCK